MRKSNATHATGQSGKRKKKPQFNARSTPPIRTITELADMVDRDKSNVGRWLKRDDWPFSRVPPWKREEVPDILRWVADTLILRESMEDGEGGGDDEHTELKKEKLRKEIRKLHAQAEQAETALGKERGTLLDAAEVERRWASIGNAVRNGFQNLSSQLVPLALSHGMPNEAAPQFQEQIDAAVNSILRRLSSHDSEPENNGDGEPEVLSGDVSAGEMDVQPMGGEPEGFDS